MGPKQSQTIAPVDNTNIECGGHAYCNGGKHSSHNKAAPQHATSKFGLNGSVTVPMPIPALQNLNVVNGRTYNATLHEYGRPANFCVFCLWVLNHTYLITLKYIYFSFAFSIDFVCQITFTDAFSKTLNVKSHELFINKTTPRRSFWSIPSLIF